MKISIREENSQVKKLGGSALISYLINAPNATLDIMRLFVGAIRPNGPLIIAQETIGNYAGVCRETVNRSVRKLHEDGVITKIYRGYRMQCEYLLNPNIEDPEVRWALMDLLPSLALTFSVVTMMPYYSQLPDSQINLNNFGSQYTTSHYIKPLSNIYKPTSMTSKNYFVVPSASKTNFEDIGASKLLLRGNVGGFTQRERGSPMESGKIFDKARVKGLNLTQAGAIKLEVFPAVARQWAWDEFRKNDKPITDPFKFYASLCLKYCTMKSHTISKRDWALMFRKLEENGLTKDSPGVQDDAYLYGPRDKPKSGPYADAVAPQPRVQEDLEKFEANMRAARDNIKAMGGGFLAELMESVMAGVEEGAKKRKPTVDKLSTVEVVDNSSTTE